MHERLYPSEFPSVGDLVIVKIIEIQEDVVYCQLLEYNRQGTLHINEVSKKHVKNIRHFVKIGVQDIMEILQVDIEKGYIDLSRKHITEDDKKTANEYYSLAKRMHVFFYRWSVKIGSDLVEKVLWPRFDPESDEPYPCILNNTEWLQDVPEEYHQQISEDLTQTFQKATKHELEIEMICYDLSGVTALQEAVDAGLAMSTEEYPLQCVYTGKTGKVGNIFQLSTVTIADPTDFLQSVANTMRTTLEKLAGEHMRFSTAKIELKK